MPSGTWNIMLIWSKWEVVGIVNNFTIRRTITIATMLCNILLDFKNRIATLAFCPILYNSCKSINPELSFL
jgi:hypothetical protein